MRKIKAKAKISVVVIIALLISFIAIFLFPKVVKSQSNTLEITCDKDVYYGLSRIEAYCNVTNGGVININFTASFPNIIYGLEGIYELRNVTYEEQVIDHYEYYEGTNHTGEVWLVSVNDTLYLNYTTFNSTLNITRNSLIPLSAVWRYSNSSSEGAFDGWWTSNASMPVYVNVTKWKYDWVPLSYITYETDGIKKYGIEGYYLNSNNGIFKIVFNVPIGSEGKFNLTVTADGESFELDPWWNSSWKYRTPITIENTLNPNTLTDYQVLVTLDTATLIYDGKMNSDCSDIRFSYLNPDSTETEIPYWIESGCNSTTTKIWVKVPYIPAASNTTIYVYYGNPSASSASNPANVFIPNSIYAMSGWYWDYIWDHWRANEVRTRYPDICTKYVSKIDWGSVCEESAFPSDVRDFFYSRFRFLFVADVSGIYTFGIDSDDGSEAMYSPTGRYGYYLSESHSGYFGETVIVSWYGPHGIANSLTDYTGTYYLDAGQGIWIDVVHSEVDGMEGIRLGIQKPGGDMLIVDANNFPNQIFARKYTSPEPRASLGEEETVIPIRISNLKTYDANLNVETTFYSEDLVRIRADVFHDNGTSYIDNVLITIKDASGNIVVNNNSMVIVSPIVNGFTYEYNYTLPKYFYEGAWKIIVYANDTLGNSISGRATFNAIQRFYPTDWQYRVPIKVIENLGKNRVNYVFWVNLTIPAGHVNNCTKEIRVTQGYPENTYSITAESLVPSRVIRESSGYCEIEFVGNVSANSFRIFYVYYGNPSAQEVTYDFNNSQFFVDYGDAPCAGYMKNFWGTEYIGGGVVDYINETHAWIGGGYTTQGSTNNCIALFDLETRSYQTYNLVLGSTLKMYADENISVLTMDDGTSGGNENAIYVFRDNSWQLLARASDFGTDYWGGIHDIACFPNGTQYECHFVKGWEASYVRFLTDKYSKTLIDIIHLPFSIHPEDVKPFEHDKFWASGQQCYSTQGFWVARWNNGVFDVNRNINRNYAGECPGTIFDMVCFDFDHCFGAGDYTVWLITPDSHTDLLPRIDLDKSICWNEGGYINCWTYQPVKLKNRNIVWFGYHAHVGWTGTKWIMYDYDKNRFNQYGYLRDANGNPIYLYEYRRSSVDILNETEGMAIGRSVNPSNGEIIRPAVWLVRSQSMEIGPEETVGAPTPPPYTEVSSCMQITSPGEYRLVSDLQLGSYPYCLDVFSNDVIIDCQGYKIQDYTGLHQYPDGINIRQNVANVTVKNCDIRGFAGEAGVFLRGNNNMIRIYNTSVIDSKIGVIGDGNDIILYNISTNNVQNSFWFDPVSNLKILNSKISATSNSRINGMNVEIANNEFRYVNADITNDLYVENTSIHDNVVYAVNDNYDTRTIVRFFLGANNAEFYRNTIYSLNTSYVGITNNSIVLIIVRYESYNVSFYNNFGYAKYPNSVVIGSVSSASPNAENIYTYSNYIESTGLLCIQATKGRNQYIYNNTILDGCIWVIGPASDTYIYDNVFSLFLIGSFGNPINNVFAYNNTIFANASAMPGVKIWYRDLDFGYRLIGSNIFHPETNTLSPYLSLVLNYTSINYGTTIPFDSYDYVGGIAIDTNMIDYKIEIDSTDLVSGANSISKNNLSFGFSKTLDFSYLITPYNTITILKQNLQDMFNILTRLFVPLVPPGSYTGTVTITVSQGLSDNQIPNPHGGENVEMV